MGCSTCGNGLVKLIIKYTAPKSEAITVRSPPRLGVKTVPKPQTVTGPFKTVGN